VGLFGTVLGVIKAFADLAGAEGSGPEVVMAGLSEALIATAVGLLVAIPAVMAYNYLMKRASELLADVDGLVAPAVGGA
jgi:biopolymer transport protein ExbB